MADDAMAGSYSYLALRAVRVDDAGMADGLSAAIIAVGSELLTPHKTDTNSLYVTEVLNDLGIAVAFKAIVGDNRAELTAHVAHALSLHPVLILTGGLGPTDDDLTREVVAAHLALPLDDDAAILDAIERRFASRGWKMPAVNRRQAQVPRGAAVLQNPHGTAPGLWIAHGTRSDRAAAGPAARDEADDGRRRAPPVVGAIAGDVRLHRRLLRVSGKGESVVEEIVQPIYSRWLDQTPRIETTILAGLGQVELHLVSQSDDAALATARLNRRGVELTQALGADLVSTDGTVLEAVVGDLLRARGWWVAFAESCTGGLATSRMTDIPGSSDYVERSVVAYSNRAKIELLDVPGGADRRTWRRQRAGRAGDGGRHSRARRRQRRRRHHRHRGTRRRHRAEAGGHGVHRR